MEILALRFYCLLFSKLLSFYAALFWYWKEFYEWTSRQNPEDTCYRIFFVVFLFQCLEGHRCERVFEFYLLQLAKCLCNADDLIHSTVNKLLNLVPQFHIKPIFLSSFATSISRQSNFFKFLLLSSRDDQAAKNYLFLIWYKALIFLPPAEILEKRNFRASWGWKYFRSHTKSVPRGKRVCYCSVDD